MRLFAAWQLVGMTGIVLLTLVVAALHDWRVMWWFGKYGEGPFELALVGALFVFAVVNLVREWRER